HQPDADGVAGDDHRVDVVLGPGEDLVEVPYRVVEVNMIAGPVERAAGVELGLDLAEVEAQAGGARLGDELRVVERGGGEAADQRVVDGDIDRLGRVGEVRRGR